MHDKRGRRRNDISAPSSDGNDDNDKPKDIDLSKESIGDAGIDRGKEGMENANLPEDTTGLRDTVRQEQAESRDSDQDSDAHEAKRDYASKPEAAEGADASAAKKAYGDDHEAGNRTAQDIRRQEPDDY